MDVYTTIITMALSGIIAAIVSFFTAKISLKNRLSEKWWDKKLQKYEEIIIGIVYVEKILKLGMKDLRAEEDEELEPLDKDKKDLLLKKSKDFTELTEAAEFYFSSKSARIINEYDRQFRKTLYDDVLNSITLNSKEKRNNFRKTLGKQITIMRDMKQKLISESRKDLKIK